MKQKKGENNYEKNMCINRMQCIAGSVFLDVPILQKHHSKNKCMFQNQKVLTRKKR